MADLKECPFCGKVDNVLYVTRSQLIKKTGRVYSHYYTCKDCGGSISGIDQLDALRKWNNRPDTKEDSQNVNQQLKDSISELWELSRSMQGETDVSMVCNDCINKLNAAIAKLESI